MDLGMNLVTKSQSPLITFSMAPNLNVQSSISSSACFYHSSLTASALPLGIKAHNQLPLFSITSLRLQYQPSVSSTLSRRLFLPSVSSIWDALTGGNNAHEAPIAVRRGMRLFRQGDVHGSLVEFDKAIELDPRQKAYLWQRALSLYYLDRFEEGAEQFRIDVAMNPNDTEESIWCFLCEAQLYGGDEARRRFLEVGQDSRPVMREAYNMFKDGGDPEKLVSAFLDGQASEYFYASLYTGLYYESQNDPDAAKLHVVAACQSPYGQRLQIQPQLIYPKKIYAKFFTQRLNDYHREKNAMRYRVNASNADRSQNEQH